MVSDVSGVTAEEGGTVWLGIYERSSSFMGE